MGRPRVATPFAAWRRWTVFPLDTCGTGRRMRARVAATDAFARRAGLCAYLVAALSIAYVVVNPGFKDYQRKTTRVIPAVLLERLPGTSG